MSSELERRFKQTDTVLRYLTVKKEPEENIRKIKKSVKAKEKEAEPPEKMAEKESLEKEDLSSEKLEEEE